MSDDPESVEGEEPKVFATANVSAIRGKDSSPYGLGMK